MNSKNTEWISAKRAALKYGTTPERIYKLCKMLDFPCKKEGSKWLVNSTELDRLIEIKEFVEEEFDNLENGLDEDDLESISIFYTEDSLDELDELLKREIKRIDDTRKQT